MPTIRRSEQRYYYIAAVGDSVPNNFQVLSTVRPESDLQLVKAVARSLAEKEDYNSGGYPHIDIREVYAQSDGSVPAPQPHDNMFECLQYWYADHVA